DMMCDEHETLVGRQYIGRNRKALKLIDMTSETSPAFSGHLTDNNEAQFETTESG
ncbi:11460_t:CDS:2, partial [Scutellospora calospora]